MEEVDSSFLEVLMNGISNWKENKIVHELFRCHNNSEKLRKVWKVVEFFLAWTWELKQIDARDSLQMK